MGKTKKPAASGGGGNEAEAAKGPSTMMSIVSLVVLTLIAAGAGGFFGMQLKQMQTEGPAAAQQKNAAGAGKSAGGHGSAPTAAEATNDHGAEGEPVAGVALVKLAPIITNMAAPAKTWIRLEAALVYPGGLPEKVELISGKITDDIVAYLRTVKLSQIEGASGFLNLREDLNERVRIRSEAKVSEIVIQAFIVE